MTARAGSLPRKGLRMRGILYSLFFLYAGAGRGYAWQMATAPLAEASNSDVSLTVSVPEGRSQFQIGEAIPLDLSFISTGAGEYELLPSFGQRSDKERVLVEPHSGWYDPVAAYCGCYFALHMHAGGDDLDSLSDRPTVARLELNEWVRFTEPGEYRIIVQSERVTGRGTGLDLSLIHI